MSALNWTTPEGIVVKPLYTAADVQALPHQLDTARWPALRQIIGQAIASKTLAEWCELLEGSDACFAPVLSMDDAPQHPHMQAREAFVTVDGVLQPAPAPQIAPP